MRVLFRRAALGAVAALLVSCDIATQVEGNPVAIAWTTCAGSEDVPTWFAVQDGEGAWRQVPPTGSTTFAFTLRTGRGAVAIFDSQGLFVIYATTAEIKSMAPACIGAVRDVAGTVAGYASLDDIEIALGTSSADVDGSSTPPAQFALLDVEAGPVDLIATKRRLTFTSTTQQKAPNSVLIRRGVTSNAVAVDFASAEATAPDLRTATIANLAANELLDLSSSLSTPTTEAELTAYVAALSNVSGDITAPFHALAANRLVSGESQVLNVASTRQTNNNTSDIRFLSRLFTEAVDLSVALGPLLNPPSITGGARPAVTYTIQPEYDKIWNFFIDQGSTAINIFRTGAYASTSSGQVRIEVPDLSAAAGFDPAWMLKPGLPAAWGFLAADASITAVIGKAGTHQGAQRQSIFTP